MPTGAVALLEVALNEYGLETYFDEERVLLVDSVTGAASELELAGAEYVGAEATLEDETGAAEDELDVEAAAEEETAAIEEVEAAAAVVLLVSSPPVGVSPARTQPVLSVRTFGQVTCL